MTYIFLDINEFTGGIKTRWAKAAKFLREKYPEHNVGKAVYGWSQSENHYIGFNPNWWNANPTNFNDARVIDLVEAGRGQIIHVNENKVL